MRPASPPLRPAARSAARLRASRMFVGVSCGLRVSITRRSSDFSFVKPDTASGRLLAEITISMSPAPIRLTTCCASCLAASKRDGETSTARMEADVSITRTMLCPPALITRRNGRGKSKQEQGRKEELEKQQEVFTQFLKGRIRLHVADYLPPQVRRRYHDILAP